MLVTSRSGRIVVFGVHSQLTRSFYFSVNIIPREHADTLTRPSEGEKARALRWCNCGGIREITSRLESFGQLLELHF